MAMLYNVITVQSQSSRDKIQNSDGYNIFFEIEIFEKVVSLNIACPLPFKVSMYMNVFFPK